jgi:hypothetical protein
MLSREINHTSFQWQKRMRSLLRRSKPRLPSLSDLARMIEEAKAAGRCEVCPPALAEDGRVTSYEGVI